MWNPPTGVHPGTASSLGQHAHQRPGTLRRGKVCIIFFWGLFCWYETCQAPTDQQMDKQGNFWVGRWWHFFTWWSEGSRVLLDEDSGHFPLQNKSWVFPKSLFRQFPIKCEKFDPKKISTSIMNPSNYLSRLVAPGVGTCVDLEAGAKWVLVLLSYFNWKSQSQNVTMGKLQCKVVI